MKYQWLYNIQYILSNYNNSITIYSDTQIFVDVEHQDIGKGRASNQSSVANKRQMAELLNCLGFFSTKFERLLLIKTKVHYEMPDSEQEEQLDERDHIKEIKERIKVRTAAKNKFFATSKENGGCTKAFYDMDDLAGHILERFGLQWRHFVKLK